SNFARGATQRFSGPLDWFRKFDFALPVPQLGARGLCFSSCAGGDVTRRGFEKIRSLRFASVGVTSAACGAGVLDAVADCTATRQYYLHRPGDPRPAATR